MRRDNVSRGDERTRRAARFGLDDNANSRLIQTPAVIALADYVAEIAGQKHDIVESVFYELLDHNVEKYRAVADLDQRLGYRTRQLAKPRAFASDQDTGLADRLRCRAGRQFRSPRTPKSAADDPG